MHNYKPERYIYASGNLGLVAAVSSLVARVPSVHAAPWPLSASSRLATCLCSTESHARPTTPSAHSDCARVRVRVVVRVPIPFSIVRMIARSKSRRPTPTHSGRHTRCCCGRCARCARLPAKSRAIRRRGSKAIATQARALTKPSRETCAALERKCRKCMRMQRRCQWPPMAAGPARLSGDRVATGVRSGTCTVGQRDRCADRAIQRRGRPTHVAALLLVGWWHWPPPSYQCISIAARCDRARSVYDPCMHDPCTHDPCVPSGDRMRPLRPP